MTRRWGRCSHRRGTAPIGITTTVPIEIIYAAGRTVVDLDNGFIASPDPADMVDPAEMAGFPWALCGWIKGIHTADRDLGLRQVIAANQGLR